MASETSPYSSHYGSILECTCRGSQRCDVFFVTGSGSWKTSLDHAEVHGFGLYISGGINRGECIGEYTSETISVEKVIAA
jgi:hypothetical protein